MKTYKTFLHIWITFVSLLTFLGGWVMLAHSRKPVQPSQNTSNSAANYSPLPTLAPLQFFGNDNGNLNNGGGLGFFAPNPQPSSGFGTLRTGGS